MMSMKKVWNRRNAPWLLSLIVVVSLVAAVTQVACTTNQTGGTQPSGNTNDNSGSPVGGAILNIQTDVTLSGGQAITILYSTPTNATNVRAFYVPVEGSGSTAVESGDEVIIASGLAAGSSKSFEFQTQELATGKYKVGIRYGDTARSLCTGVITITGLPAPTFISPSQSVSVVRGAQVDVRVDLGSAENAVNWRLFYMDFGDSLTAFKPDQYGMELQTGTQNVLIYYWNTAGVEPGQYTLGISSTDSGKTIAQSVAAGEEDTIVTTLSEVVVTVLAEEPESTKPSATVVQPEYDVSIFSDGQVPIQFVATAYDGSPSDWKVDVFYDSNASYSGTDGTETFISTGLPINTTNATFDTEDVAEGTYYLGVLVHDGLNNPGVDYAPGKVVLTRTPQLSIIEPSVEFKYKPDEEVDISWTTNIPEEIGTITVAVQQIDANDQDVGSPEYLLENASTTINQVEYTTKSVGRFRVTITLKAINGEFTTITKDAPQLIYVSTLPTIFWLGDLTKNEPAYSGAIFEGVNFEDNAGTAFEGGFDFNSDGKDEFLIVARYAKPEFINPSGLGAGEAYMLSSPDRERFKGTYNLNTTSSEDLHGIVMTGLSPNYNLREATLNQFTADFTFGLAAIQAIQDSDGDGKKELVFGFPLVENRRSCTNYCIFRQSNDQASPFESQFKYGGIVVLSSQSNPLANTGFWDMGYKLELDNVGVFFEEMSVKPEPSDGAVQTLACSWNDDLYGKRQGECESWDYDEETGTITVDDLGLSWGWGYTEYAQFSPDGDWDSWVGPDYGFAPFLAKNYFEWRRARGNSITLTRNLPSLRCEDEWTETTDSGEVLHTCSCWGIDLPTMQPLWGSSYYPADSLRDNGNLNVDSCMTVYLPDSDNEANPVQIECSVLQESLDAAVLTDWNRVANIEIDKQDLAQVGSGYYPDKYLAEGMDESSYNYPISPYGCRIIGCPNDTITTTVPCDPDGNLAEEFQGHKLVSTFGSSFTVSGNYLVVTAPYRDAAPAGTYTGVSGTPWPGDDQLRVDGLPVWVYPSDYSDVAPYLSNYPGAGVGYMFSLSRLWTEGTGGFIPPKPHMYLAGGGGLGYVDGGWRSDDNPPAGYDMAGREDIDDGFKIIGNVGEHIRNVVGIEDFNNDSRPDLAIGSPEADFEHDGTPEGALYVAFRRTPSLEGDYVLAKLALNPNDPRRLNGILIWGPDSANGPTNFGDGVATGVDFNSNGYSDIVVTAPLANAGKGEVYIIFDDETLITPEGGEKIETLLTQFRAARITGMDAGELFGFTVGMIGDINNDGYGDLAIAAPNATPKFDSNPYDTNFSMDQEGLDLVTNDGDCAITDTCKPIPDGLKDDISGPNGVPDGTVNGWDTLTSAGVVYVLFGPLDVNTDDKTANNPWWNDSDDIFEINVEEIGSKALPGFVIVGRRGGDQLGGGFAGALDPSDPYYNYTQAPQFGYGTSGGQGNIYKIPQGSLGANPTLPPSDNGRSYGLNSVGDVDGDGKDDFMIGSILADPRVNANTGDGVTNGGEAYLIYGFTKNVTKDE